MSSEARGPFALDVSEWDKTRNDIMMCFPRQSAVKGRIYKLAIRTDESTPRYAIYFHETDQTDKGKKNQAELCRIQKYKCMKVASLNSTASGASAAPPEESTPSRLKVTSFPPRYSPYSSG